jgi:hypothetical protein
VIEINPRMARSSPCSTNGSTASIRTRCCSSSPWARRRAHERAAPRFRHAASFAFRKFDGKPLAVHPTREQIERAQREFPEARLMLYLKRGRASHAR